MVIFGREQRSRWQFDDVRVMGCIKECKKMSSRLTWVRMKADYKKSTNGVKKRGVFSNFHAMDQVIMVGDLRAKKGYMVVAR